MWNVVLTAQSKGRFFGCVETDGSLDIAVREAVKKLPPVSEGVDWTEIDTMDFHCTWKGEK